MKFKLYKGKTPEGNWVYGSLVYSEDCEDEYQAIIIPIKDNGMFTKEDISYPISGSDKWYLKEKGKERFESETLGFEVWYKVDINTVEEVSEPCL